MYLILCRHGNTFDKGDKVVFTGCRQDFPLVARGHEQAQACAHALRTSGVILASVYCGPLLRTRATAEMIAAQNSPSLGVAIDSRLDEIDYGAWAGLSSEEVASAFGQATLDAWNRLSIRPVNCGWAPSEEDIISQVRSFAAQTASRHGVHDKVLAVSSNGRLRYFLHLLPGEFKRRVQAGSFKVGTGHLCCLEFRDNNWNLLFWDVSPDNLKWRP